MRGLSHTCKALGSVPGILKYIKINQMANQMGGGVSEHEPSLHSTDSVIDESN